jgi:hypothetical protein
MEAVWPGFARLESEVIWTYSKFLSKRPIKDTYAAIETPERSGLIPADTPAEMEAVQGAIDTPLSAPATPIVPPDMGSK